MGLAWRDMLFLMQADAQIYSALQHSPTRHCRDEGLTVYPAKPGF